MRTPEQLHKFLKTGTRLDPHMRRAGRFRPHPLVLTSIWWRLTLAAFEGRQSTLPAGIRQEERQAGWPADDQWPVG